MSYRETLKRAWGFVGSYRALWLFGALLALTTVNGFYFFYDLDGDDGWQGITVRDNNTLYLRGQGITIDFRGRGLPRIEADDWDTDDVREFLRWRWWGDISSEVKAIIISSAVVLAGMILFGLVARYVAEAGLIRMVDRTEETGEKLRMRQGLRLGFSRSAWRLFLVDLLVFLLKALVFGALLAGALSPLLLWTTRSRAAGIAGTAVTVGLLVLWLVLVLAASAALSLLVQVVRRACAIDGLGVLSSVRRGLLTVRKNLKQVIVVWFIWIGIRLAWMLAAVPVLIAVSPLILPFVLAGVVIGGLPAVAVGGALRPFLEGPFPWIVGAIVGGPIFVLVMSIPWLLVGGLVEVLKSCTWTLTYRELRSLESTEPVRATETSVADLEAVPVA